MPKYPITIKIKTARIDNPMRTRKWRVVSGEWCAGIEVGDKAAGLTSEGGEPGAEGGDAAVGLTAGAGGGGSGTDAMSIFLLVVGEGERLHLVSGHTLTQAAGEAISAPEKC
jgi:hypothetical protein